MPDFKHVRMDLLDGPPNPMRSDSFAEGMAELISSIAEEGLHQPIGVRAKPDGRYRVIFGHRRSYACQELKWAEIPALVYAEHEGDDDTAMGSENFQRSSVNMAEEARFYRRMVTDRGMSQAEISRRWKRPPARVSQLLSLTEGNDEILHALGASAISLAQAVEIAKIGDDYGREQALHYASHDGLSAQMIRVWAEGREVSGISQSIQELKESGADQGAVNYRQQVQCNMCSQWPRLEDAVHRMMCNDCWGLLVQLYESYHSQMQAMQQAEGVEGKEGH